MSRVYLAVTRTSRVPKLVVLKVLNQELAAEPDMRQAFRREAEISASLNHPNIVQVFEGFEDLPSPVIVMQYLDGLALSDILRRARGALPLRLHLYMLTQLLAGLHYFHELRDANDAPLHCVHRDVSPHNVLALYEGGVKLLDFGIAKACSASEHHTRSGVIKGKVRYMSAEQLMGARDIDRRADIYSVGVMLWEAVTNRRMWPRADSGVVSQAILRGRPPSVREAAPDVPDELAAIVERALAPDRADRYPTAKEIQLDLERILQGESQPAYARTLADFMQDNFGEDRRVRQLAIRAALRTPELGRSVQELSAPPVFAAERALERAPATGECAREGHPSWRARLASPRLYDACLAAAMFILAVVFGVRAVRQYSELRALSTQADARSSEAASLVARHKERSHTHFFADPGVGRAVATADRGQLAQATSSSSRLRADDASGDSVPRTGEAVAASDRAHSHAAKAILVLPPEPDVNERVDEGRGRSGARAMRGAKQRVARTTRVLDAPVVRALSLANRRGPTVDCVRPYRLERDGVKTFTPECF